MAGLAGKADGELGFIKSLLTEAGSCALHYFDSGVNVDVKGDGSPVTVADREVEALIRLAIEKEFPDDGILGEEEEEKHLVRGNGRNRKWIIDPIDGTMNFSRGIPIFSILLALEVEGEIVSAAIYNPVWKDMYLAAAGFGAYKNDQPLKVSDRAILEEALIAFGGPDRIAQTGIWDRLLKVVKSTYRQRGYGDYLGFAYVFEGRVEANIEIGLKPWDLAPMKLLVEESGGLYLDFEGGSSIYQGSCVVGNKHLAESIREIVCAGTGLE